MKKLIFSLSFMLVTQALFSQQYYPMADPCDPDKVFEKLPSAAYDNNCVFKLNITSQPFKFFPLAK
jgi:hypothetical protein